MSTIQSIRFYITKMFDEVKGYKILLLDEETTKIVSVCYSLTESYKEGTLLNGLLKDHKNRQVLKDVSCVCFIRPTIDNIHELKVELTNPKYQEYHIFFSNIISSDLLESVASADQREVVKSVHEYYADYLALDDHIFTLDLKSVFPLYNKNFVHPSKNRICDGIVSALLSMKKRPCIRYDRNSELCKLISKEVSSQIEQEAATGLFDFKKDNIPLLLILDRRDDPVTPLLQQWTYQAMVHELLGIEDNRIAVDKRKDEEDKPEVQKKLESMILSAKQDEFFSKNMYLNWGELCSNIHNLVEGYKTNHKIAQSVSSLDDIKSFMGQFPQFKKEQATVDKHVTLVYKLKELIEKRKMKAVSRVEQETICGKNPDSILRMIQEIIGNQELALSAMDAVRLVMLYSLRFETTKSSEIQGLLQLLRKRSVKQKHINLIETMKSFAGASVRNPGLFTEEVSLTSMKSIIEFLRGDLNDVESVFTQHKPLLRTTLMNLASGKLNEKQYPFYSMSSLQVPKEVIIFIIGGITYEESLTVFQFNNADAKVNGGMKVVLGGNCILNSKLFLRDLKGFGQGRLDSTNTTSSTVATISKSTKSGNNGSDNEEADNESDDFSDDNDEDDEEDEEKDDRIRRNQRLR